MQWRRLKFFKNVKIIDKCFNVIKMWVECHQLWQSLSSSTDILQTCLSSGLGSAWNILHHYQVSGAGWSIDQSHTNIKSHLTNNIISDIILSTPSLISTLSVHTNNTCNNASTFTLTYIWDVNLREANTLKKKTLFFITLKACSQCNNILIISAGVHSAALQRSDKCWKPLSQLPLASNI